MVVREGEGARPLFFKVVFLPGSTHITLFELIAIKSPHFSLLQLEKNGS